MSRVRSALLSIALAGVVTLAAYADPIIVAAVVLVIQCMIAAAPSPADAGGHSVNAPRFGAAVIAGLVATAVTVHPVLLSGAEGTHAGDIGAIDSGVFAGMAPGVAIGVLVTLVSQMLRRDGRKSLVLTTGYAVTLCAFSALTIGWIGAAQSLGGAPAVAVGAVSLSTALLVWLVPYERWVVGVAAVTAAAATGGVAAQLLGAQSEMSWPFGAAAGLGVGMFAILGQVLGQVWCSGRRHASSAWGFPGALSLALAAPIVFVASQLIGASFSFS